MNVLNLDTVEVSGLDSMFFSYKCGSILSWFIEMLIIVIAMDNRYSKFSLAALWVPSTFLTCDLTDFLQSLPKVCSYSLDVMNIVDSGYSVFAARTLITIVKDHELNENYSSSCGYFSLEVSTGYTNHIRKIQHNYGVSHCHFTKRSPHPQTYTTMFQPIITSYSCTPRYFRYRRI